MYLTDKAWNAARALLQSYSPPHLKKLLWNREFSTGRWDCLDTTPGDCVYPYIEKYAANGSILDLGCGSGSTANEVAESTYQHYTGVDISDVAIGRAMTKTSENRRVNKDRFVQADFYSYVPVTQHDVILFRDSLYYVPLAKLRSMLIRYSTYLTQDGVFIVRLWGAERNKTIVSVIEKNFEIVEKESFEKPKAIVIVFK